MREPIITNAGGGDPVDPKGTPREPRPVDQMDEKLRPQTLAEVVGQRSVAERLAIALSASRKRGEPLPHILFDGPPGLGKTTFATVLPNELGTEHPDDLRASPGQASPPTCCRILTNAGGRLHPLHRRDPPPAQDRRGVHLSRDGGLPRRRGSGRGHVRADDQPPVEEVHHHRRDHAIGDALTGPLRDRFQMHEHLEFYEVEDLAKIVSINSTKLRTTVTEEAAWELGRAQPRARPRLANCAAPLGARLRHGPRRRPHHPDHRPRRAGHAGRWTPRGWTSRTAAIWRL